MHIYSLRSPPGHMRNPANPPDRIREHGRMLFVDSYLFFFSVFLSSLNIVSCLLSAVSFNYFATTFNDFLLFIDNAGAFVNHN